MLHTFLDIIPSKCYFKYCYCHYRQNPCLKNVKAHKSVTRITVGNKANEIREEESRKDICKIFEEMLAINVAHYCPVGHPLRIFVCNSVSSYLLDWFAHLFILETFKIL
jgi:hypothetical protein